MERTGPLTTNYEVVPFRIRADIQQAEQLERWLEQASGRGGEPVPVMPSVEPATTLAIFRVATKGAVRTGGWDTVGT